LSLTVITYENESVAAKKNFRKRQIGVSSERGKGTSFWFTLPNSGSAVF
jgi:hypothetical protein